jgi:putative ABC transport system permease protein
MSIQMTLALRYLQGRKLRTVLTTLAIVFGVMVLFGLGAVIPTMTQVFRQGLMSSAGKVDLTVTHSSGGTFSAGQAGVLRKLDGIAQASGSLRQNITLPPALSNAGNGVNALTIVGVDVATASGVRSFPLVAGRFLAPGDDKAIIMSDALAKKLGLSIGDTYTLPSAEGTTTFTLIGVVSTIFLPGSEEVYMPLATAEKVLNQPGAINTIEAIFTPGADATKVETTAGATLGANYRTTPLDEGSSVFSSAIGIGTNAMALIGVLALTMGGFIIFNTFRTVVAERRHDLGMLRALGATRRTIMGLMLIEALIQGVAGSAIGLVAGYGLAWLGVAVISPLLEQYWHRNLGAPPITLGNLFIAVLLGVGVTVVSALLPARAATRVTPMEARCAHRSPASRPRRGAGAPSWRLS